MKKSQIVLKILIEGGRYPQFHTTVCFINDVLNQKRILYDLGFPYDRKMMLDALELHTISPSTIDYIILSHWHIDHCGLLDLFPTSKIIISSESLFMIEKGLQGVLEAESSVHQPVEYLKEYIIKQMTINDFLGSVDDNINKVRAMANMVYRNQKCWFEIRQRVKNGFGIVLKEDSKRIGSIEIKKVSAHTKGDLIVHFIDQNNLSCYLVGDVIPLYKDKHSIPMLTEDIINYNNVYNNIYHKGNRIIPGHGGSFIV